MDENLSKWFIEAQQSLGIAGPLCSRANDMITTCRSQIEHAIVVWAKISFMKSAISQQFTLLDEIKKCLKGIHSDFTTKFQTILSELDATGATLNRTLESLEKTELDEALKPNSGIGHSNGGDSNSQGSSNEISQTWSNEDRKTKNLRHYTSEENKDSIVTLRSFVHEEGLQQLRKEISRVIDKAQESGNEVNDHIANLEVSMAELNKRMQAVKAVKRQSIEQANDAANSITENAHSMAGLLESLTRHYDLSLQGVEMAKNKDKDLHQLYEVLEHDSELVEGVIEELYGKQKVIEKCDEEVSNFSSQMKEAQEIVTSFFDLFDNFGTSRLIVYSESFDRIVREQNSYIDEIQKLKKELESLSDYYMLFLKSYHAMILEIVRRKKSQVKIESTVQEMRSILDKVYEDEVEARKKFIEERGDYLPSDLWEGLSELPPSCELSFNKAYIPPVSVQSVTQAVNSIQI